MQLLILLAIALLVGYWLSRSKYHTSVDNAIQQPKIWWNRLFHRSPTEKTAELTSDSEEKQEK
jgi:hypothetical protein